MAFDIARRAFLAGMLSVLVAGLPVLAEARRWGGRGSDWRSGPSYGTRALPPRIRPHPRLPSRPQTPRVRLPFSRGGHSVGLLPGRPRSLVSSEIRTVDGDTFRAGGRRVRIRGMNAAELSGPGGVRARARLDQVLRSGSVTMVPRGVDRYGRTVADVYVNGRNVAEMMRADGLAR
jgi:hypothetical protein